MTTVHGPSRSRLTPEELQTLLRQARYERAQTLRRLLGRLFARQRDQGSWGGGEQAPLKLARPARC